MWLRPLLTRPHLRPHLNPGQHRRATQRDRRSGAFTEASLERNSNAVLERAPGHVQLGLADQKSPPGLERLPQLPK